MLIMILVDRECTWKLKLISELLCIKHQLDLFKAHEVSVVIDFLCTTYIDVVFSPIVFIFF